MPLPKIEVVSQALLQLSETYNQNAEKFGSLVSLSDTKIDPLAALLHMTFSNVSRDLWFNIEKTRRLDKALTNKIGFFHEYVLQSIPEWEKPPHGFDLRNETKKIIIEVKNKYNTMNSGSTREVFEKSERFVNANNGWTVYLAQIIAKSGRCDEPWVISGRTGNPAIRKIDGATLYDIVTGEEEALKRTYEMIPKALENINHKVQAETQAFFMELFSYTFEE